MVHPNLAVNVEITDNNYVIMRGTVLTATFSRHSQLLKGVLWKSPLTDSVQMRREIRKVSVGVLLHPSVKRDCHLSQFPWNSILQDNMLFKELI